MTEALANNGYIASKWQIKINKTKYKMKNQRYHKINILCKGTLAASLTDVRLAFLHSTANCFFTLKLRLTALLKTALIFNRESLLKKTFVLQHNMFRY
jgi:hypothetical protein